jgi:hypothetical protein
MNRMTKVITIVAAALAATTATAQAATRHVTAYDSTPVAGTVSVPSVGPEAYSFNQVGNEVLMKRPGTISRVRVTLVSWACETGSWSDGSCLTTPGATFPVPVTLHLYRYGNSNPATGEVTPGRELASITRTFSVHYRPSSVGGGESRFVGRDGALHNGLDQNVRFPVHRVLPADVIWTVSYDTNTSGFNPLGVVSPTDSLNVGLSPAVTTGHDRFPGGIFWDTRVAGYAAGAPFVPAELNLDDHNAWAGYVPAAKFVR